jgi:hypothetical protein
MFLALHTANGTVFPKPEQYPLDEQGIVYIGKKRVITSTWWSMASESKPDACKLPTLFSTAVDQQP